MIKARWRKWTMGAVAGLAAGCTGSSPTLPDQPAIQNRAELLTFNGGTVDLEPGEHRLNVRATDRSGYTQTAVRTDVVPNGASGWDTHPFTAV